MEWSPEQDRALSTINDWVNDRGADQVFRVFGYAGTGKTTIAKAIAEGVDGKVLFGAYTGKAAHVLQTKGCEGASTIHSLIYHGRDQSAARLKQLEVELLETRSELLGELPPEERHLVDGHPAVLDLVAKIDLERQNASRPLFQLNYESEVKFADLVIIDECSMVDGQMAEDLLFFGTKVLVLGDPAQLPPVMGSGYFIQAEPDVMLKEIHRQARDNPIIAMASHVREGNPLAIGTYRDITLKLLGRKL